MCISRRYHKAVITLCRSLSLTQVSRAVYNGSGGIGPEVLATSLAGGVALHALLLAINAALVKLLGLGGKRPGEALPIRQAVVLLSSQKTLPVAVTVIELAGESVAGVASMTVVLAHLSQIVMDSAMVSWWLQKHGRIDEQRGTA